MVLTEKEITVLKDLQTQEKSCIEKYTRYSSEAKDTQLQSLFKELATEERKHFQSLGDAIKGDVPSVDCNDRQGKEYQPKACYSASEESEDKKNDCFLATDCIGTEKLVSGTYNDDVFVFGDPKVRRLLADIQIEEQNHAEMLWKYKNVNGMC